MRWPEAQRTRHWMRELPTPSAFWAVWGVSAKPPFCSPCTEAEKLLRLFAGNGQFSTCMVWTFSCSPTPSFCRLSAVFGGVFALNQPSLSALKLESHHVEALANGEQEIKAQHFVLGAEHSPSQFLSSSAAKDNQISRAVFITDQSLSPSEQEHLTLLVYPPEEEKPLATILEMGHLTGTCPKGLCKAPKVSLIQSFQNCPGCLRFAAYDNQASLRASRRLPAYSQSSLGRQ